MAKIAQKTKQQSLTKQSLPNETKDIKVNPDGTTDATAMFKKNFDAEDITELRPKNSLIENIKFNTTTTATERLQAIEDIGTLIKNDNNNSNTLKELIYNSDDSEIKKRLDLTDETLELKVGDLKAIVSDREKEIELINRHSVALDIANNLIRDENLFINQYGVGALGKGEDGWETHDRSLILEKLDEEVEVFNADFTDPKKESSISKAIDKKELFIGINSGIDRLISIGTADATEKGEHPDRYDKSDSMWGYFRNKKYLRNPESIKNMIYKEAFKQLNSDINFNYKMDDLEKVLKMNNFDESDINYKGLEFSSSKEAQRRKDLLSRANDVTNNLIIMDKIEDKSFDNEDKNLFLESKVFEDNKFYQENKKGLRDFYDNYHTKNLEYDEKLLTSEELTKDINDIEAKRKFNLANEMINSKNLITKLLRSNSAIKSLSSCVANKLTPDGKLETKNSGIDNCLEKFLEKVKQQADKQLNYLNQSLNSPAGLMALNPITTLFYANILYQQIQAEMDRDFAEKIFGYRGIHDSINNTEKLAKTILLKTKDNEHSIDYLPKNALSDIKNYILKNKFIGELEKVNLNNIKEDLKRAFKEFDIKDNFEVKNELDKSIEILESEVKELNETYQQKEEKDERLKRILNDSEEKLKQLVSSLEEREEALKEVESTTENFDTLSKVNQEYRDNIQKIKSEIDEFKYELKHNETHFNELKDKIETKENEIKQFKNDSDNFNYESLNRELSIISLLNAIKDEKNSINKPYNSLELKRLRKMETIALANLVDEKFDNFDFGLDEDKFEDEKLKLIVQEIKNNNLNSAKELLNNYSTYESDNLDSQLHIKDL